MSGIDPAGPLPSDRDLTRLLREEQKRSAQLSMIHEVSKIAMSILDPDEMMQRVADAIQRNFEYYDCVLFSVDRASGEAVLKAHAGAYASLLPAGYRQGLGTGIIGWVATEGKPLLANDVAVEPRRFIAFPEEASTRSELCVPIQLGDVVVGVIDVQSPHKNAFDKLDLETLSTLADQIAGVIHNASLYQEMRSLKELNERIVDAVPSPAVLLDVRLNIIAANRSYCRLKNKRKEDLQGHNLRHFAPLSVILREDVLPRVLQVAETGESARLVRVNYPHRDWSGYLDRIVNIFVSTVPMERENLLLVVIEDVTEVVEQAYELSLLRQIGEVMQRFLDLDHLLHAILTCVTAGSALGFNRAVLLLVDAAGATLEGKMAVGPANKEDAWRIWSQVEQQRLTLSDILEEYDRLADKSELPLCHLARSLRIPLTDTAQVLVKTVLEKRAFHVVNSGSDERVGVELSGVLGADEFVSVPLIAKGRAIGVIVADNLYSGLPILDESIQLLTLFANQAGLAVENASIYESLEEKVSELEHAYVQLKQVQEDLVHSERLSAIGEMSAHVAHEIRNPLTTVGGFARSILKQPDDPQRTRKGLAIIVEEVNRLEKILTAILDYTKPSRREDRKLHHLNPLVLDVVELVREMTLDPAVSVHLDLGSDLPEIPIDTVQIGQVLLNLLHNALHAMPVGGDLRVRTWEENRSIGIEISDTGTGIPQEIMKQVFLPFFTTKTYGTGLGLAVSQKIIHDHGGRIAIQSRTNEGTTVTLYLPFEEESI